MRLLSDDSSTKMHFIQSMAWNSLFTPYRLFLPEGQDNLYRRLYFFTAGRFPLPGEEFKTIEGYNFALKPSALYSEISRPVKTCENGFASADDGTACTACNIAHAFMFGAECEVVSCEIGYKVSETKAACEPCNVPHATSRGQVRCEHLREWLFSVRELHGLS